MGLDLCPLLHKIKYCRKGLVFYREVTVSANREL
jgi:hypothetical protein